MLVGIAATIKYLFLNETYITMHILLLYCTIYKNDDIEIVDNYIFSFEERGSSR